ncbi:MAG: TonB family protein, partial [Myxococcaceae bacterium]
PRRGNVLSESLDVPLDDLFDGDPAPAAAPVRSPEIVSSRAPIVDENILGRTVAGRYQVLERIGAGGMGRVYKAFDLRGNRVVALKVLERKHPDPAFIKRFKLEAAITSQLRHPNTIQVVDHGTSPEGLLFIAMEYLQGQTLAELLGRTHALPWQRAVHIIQQICRSLREAHRLGLVHRDLKPANVMLIPDGQGRDLVKVLDFGLAKQFDEERMRGGEITANGMIVGSPQYMAPEQATGARADPRSDIYSLGVLFYEALCGRPPFQARQYITVLLKHVHDAPPPMRHSPAGTLIPDGIEAVVMRCLAKEPAKRFQSMDEVLGGIVRAASVLGEELTIPLAGVDQLIFPGDEPPPPKGDRLSRGLLYFLGIAAAGVLIVSLKPFLLEKLILGEPAPASAAKTSPSEQMPADATAKPRERIFFKVSSDPLGAAVSLRGQVLGSTPLQFSIPASPDGTARVELEFNREGYFPLITSAGGSGPVITLAQKLRPLPKLERKRARTAVPEKTEPVLAPEPAPLSASDGDVLTLNGEETTLTSGGPIQAAPKTPPEVVETKEPIYPRAALEAHVGGTVTARCRISEKGQASGCQILKGVPFMDEAVIAALEASRYRPATLAGKPIADEYTLQVSLQPPPR